MSLIDKIENFLAVLLGEPEWQSFFLLEVRHGKGNHIEITLDGDQGLSLGDCRKISRKVQEKIDTEGWLTTDYTLDVSSPGTTRPLEIPRQYPKHIGRTLEIKMAGQENKIEGKLLSSDENEIVVEEIVEKKIEKKKVKEIIQHKIPFARIENAIVKISFK